MTRKRYKKLVMALSIRIAHAHGSKATGDMLKKQRDSMCRESLRDFGSYEAAWEWMKPVRDLYMGQ